MARLGISPSCRRITKSESCIDDSVPYPLDNWHLSSSISTCQIESPRGITKLRPWSVCSMAFSFLHIDPLIRKPYVSDQNGSPLKHAIWQICYRCRNTGCKENPE